MRQEQELRPVTTRRVLLPLLIAVLLPMWWFSASVAQPPPQAPSAQGVEAARAEKSELPTMDVALCLPAVAPAWQRRNASLNLVAEFRVDPDGRPTDIEVLRTHDALRSTDLVDCLRRWKLGGWEVGEKAVVAMYWKHGYGWEHLKIIRNSGELRIALPRHLHLAPTNPLP